MTDFNNAIERIVAGLEKKNRLLNEHERKVTAYHEMGHALVARAIPGSDPIHKVSIIPRLPHVQTGADGQDGRLARGACRGDLDFP